MVARELRAYHARHECLAAAWRSHHQDRRAATIESVAARFLGGDQGGGQPGQQRLETVALATDLFGMNLRDLLHEIALAIHIGELFEYDPGRAIDADTIALLKCSAFQRFGPIENQFFVAVADDDAAVPRVPSKTGRLADARQTVWLFPLPPLGRR